MQPRRLLAGFLVLCAAAVTASAGAVPKAPEGMVLVPAGPFTMGTDQGAPYEAPAHRVELPAFFIDRTEVTVAQYARFVEATGHPAPPDWPGGKADPKRLQYPVVNVSWYDANAYARWAGKRLPTEKEWEKAARGADGRPLPWGAEWDEERANVEGKDGDRPLQPVGSYSAGASPCGALDLVGNAWEWTSDWFEAYPGNPVPSVHFGRKYRVVRGLGSINFYNSPPLTQQNAAARARVQPFGRYDSLGFRCVVDGDGKVKHPPTEVQPPSRREKPVPPRIETPAEVAARYAIGVPVVIRETAGMDRHGVATFGLPFPEGVVRSVSAIRTGTPVQARPLAKWRDGSIRWALLDVPVAVKKDRPQRAVVRWDGRGEIPEPARRVSLQVEGLAESPEGVRIDTGAVALRIRKGDAHWLRLLQGSRWLEGPEDRISATEEKGEAVALRMRGPEKITVEDSGPLRARVRVEGWLEDDRQQPVIRYRCRLDARAGSPHVGLVHTFTHLSPRKMLLIRDYALHFRHSAASEPAAPVIFGGDAAPHAVRSGACLEQTTDAAYRVQIAGRKVAEGTRAPGWMALGPEPSFLIGVKHFWQQFPKALAADRNGATVHVWTGKEAFEADQGLSKTHELVLSLDAGGPGRAEALAQLNEPFFGIAPADWYCATRGLGVLAPFSLSKYPQYEVELEAAADLMVRDRPYGMRHFGDNYFGGPYKGINAYQNLEYDVAYNHLMQFARTGARKYLDTALIQARHQGDIDMKHDQGPQWKHSPRHTTTEAELGHVFLRGLVASTWLTGDPEGLENARILGDWLIKVVANPRSQGNERQIGWSLYALTGIYEATWDDRYLQAMKANVDRLLAGQDSLGRFAIRWDNRISFFYGITLSGFVKYFEVTGDPRIEESIRRIVTRIHGFYPEYGGRTLEGLAWLYSRTGDPEVRDTCRRTWESTLDWRALDIGGTSIFTTRFLPYVEMMGLACPKEWQIPDTGPVEDGLTRHYFRASAGTLILQARESGQPVELVILRHVGQDPATVEVTSLAPSKKGNRGIPFQRHVLPASGESLSYLKLRLPPGGPYRVRLQSEKSRGWTLLTSRPTRRVWHVPDWRHLEALTPRLYFRPEPGAEEVRLVLAGEKEGFKGAVIYDPQGRVAGVLSRFIDYGDDKRHTYEFRVPLSGREMGDTGRGTGLWSLDLQQVSVSRAEGMLSYVSTHPAAFFLPRP